MTEKDFNRIPAYTECPFLANLVIKEHKKLKEIASFKTNKSFKLMEEDFDTDLGIPAENVKFNELVLADKQTYEGNFVKMFRADFLPKLNIYAIKIFSYIVKNLEVNNNKIGLKVIDLQRSCDIEQSRRIYEGLKDLMDNGILAKTSYKEVYYVNPSIIFRGVNRKILFTHKNY